MSRLLLNLHAAAAGGIYTVTGVDSGRAPETLEFLHTGSTSDVPTAYPLDEDQEPEMRNLEEQRGVARE